MKLSPNESAVDDVEAAKLLVERCRNGNMSQRAIAAYELQVLCDRNGVEFKAWLFSELESVEPHGSVYVIINQSRSAIKIGWSSDVTKRLQTLNSATWEQLECVAECKAHRSVETHLHRWASRHRIRGEWYTYSESLIETLVWFVTENKGRIHAC